MSLLYLSFHLGHGKFIHSRHMCSAFSILSKIPPNPKFKLSFVGCSLYIHSNLALGLLQWLNINLSIRTHIRL
uniref:Uncharacterized protein n=1 Tax=Arundo donax TaxID=35708 RepID=A0A0A8ZAU8_ARUDO